MPVSTSFRSSFGADAQNGTTVRATLPDALNVAR